MDFVAYTGAEKKESPCVAHRKVHVCRCKVMEAGGDGRKEDSVDVAVLQSEHVNQSSLGFNGCFSRHASPRVASLRPACLSGGMMFTIMDRGSPISGSHAATPLLHVEKEMRLETTPTSCTKVCHRRGEPMLFHPGRLLFKTQKYEDLWGQVEQSWGAEKKVFGSSPSCGQTLEMVLVT